jgi:crossover junction endodeoxyribonuclease RuvC
MPKQGVTSTFTFGRGFGALCMGLTAAEIPYDLVSSMKWMGAMQCRTGGDKSVSKRRAQQLFPQVKVTDYLADSLLIAEYLRRRERMVVS